MDVMDMKNTTPLKLFHGLLSVFPEIVNHSLQTQEGGGGSEDSRTEEETLKYGLYQQIYRHETA